MNTYRAFLIGVKPIEVEAETSYAAQQKAAAIFGVGKKTYKVSVVLLAVGGAPVLHSGAEL